MSENDDEFMRRMRSEKPRGFNINVGEIMRGRAIEQRKAMDRIWAPLMRPREPKN